MLANRLTIRLVARRFTGGSGPLKRTSDRLECLARVALAVALLAGVAVALAVATTTASVERRQVVAQTAERHQVVAELLDDAAARYDGSEGVADVGLATAAWTDRAGVRHTGTISVPLSAKAGSVQTIWVDRDGNRTSRPLNSGDVAAQSVGFAFVTYLWTALVAWTAYRGVRWLLDRKRSRQWAAEWADVEPEWTGKVP
jgi:hypothetical protein